MGIKEGSPGGVGDRLDSRKKEGYRLSKSSFACASSSKPDSGRNSLKCNFWAASSLYRNSRSSASSCFVSSSCSCRSFIAGVRSLRELSFSEGRGVSNSSFPWECISSCLRNLCTSSNRSEDIRGWVVRPNPERRGREVVVGGDKEETVFPSGFHLVGVESQEEEKKGRGWDGLVEEVLVEWWGW